MNEFEFINSIQPSAYKQSSLIKGIGDDAAVFRGGEDIVVASDTFVENIHFSEKTTNSFQVGYRALAANISDMAAMGATPKFYLVSIVIPSSKSTESVQKIYNGMESLAANFQIDLIGGDTVSGNELIISITIIGYVNKNKSCYRSNAKENDIVFVSGTLGDSRAGLEILNNRLDNIIHKEYYINRHQQPSPRVKLGEKLAMLDRVALNDISDGVASELNELAAASDVDIEIEDTMVPTHASYSQFTPKEQFDWKYFGGEDFELVGTTGANNICNLEMISQQLNLPITIIGIVKAKQDREPKVFLMKDNKKRRLLKKGYTHLEKVSKYD